VNVRAENEMNNRGVGRAALEPLCTRSTRRAWLKRSAAVAAGAFVPYLCTTAPARAISKNDRLRLGAIGLGGQGCGDAQGAMQFADLVACCDVDRNRAERFVRGRNIPIYEDFRTLLDRPDIDVVTIATPDHWHAAIAVRALRSGKDVYCEKPLTLTIDEGKLICRTVRQTGRVLQVGTQQRSTGPFLKALALVRSGRLGKVTRAVCSLGCGPRGGPFPVREPPPGLNWDFWLGQAPHVPYVSERCHYRFRWWFEYSGGKLTDWGAHHVDIAQWALGQQHTGPVSIEGRGELPSGANCYNTPVAFQCELTFADASTILVRHGPANGPWFDPLPLPRSATYPDQQFSPDNGIWLEGDRGRIFVNRQKLVGDAVDELGDRDEGWLRDAIHTLYQGRQPGDHMANFFQCVRERRPPISDAYTHHRTVSSCHLANIALRLGRKLTWDPVREDFVGDAEASAMVSRRQRQGYRIEELT
jgi:predicted dehydrogenase